MTQQWTASALAEWCRALDPDSMPEAVLIKTENCIIDTIACALAGRDAVGMCGVDQEARAAIVEHHAALLAHQRGAERLKQRIDKRDRVAVAIYNRNVDGVAMGGPARRR